jgi:hypothetical protein
MAAVAQPNAGAAAAGAAAKESHDEVRRFGRMLAYFVIVQIIMTTAGNKWGAVFSSVDAVTAYAVAYPANLVASFQRLRSTMMDTSMRETMVMPSYEEARAFFMPRLMLIVLCALVVFVSRVGLNALKRRIPETGISFATVGAASKASAGITRRSGGRSAKAD